MISAAATTSKTAAVKTAATAAAASVFRSGAAASGIGTIVVLGLIGWALGIDPRILIGGAEMVNSGRHHQQPYEPSQPRQAGAPKDKMGDFVAAVLGNTEDTWTEIFKSGGQQYRVPRLRLFSGAIQGGCGIRAIGDGPVLLPERPAHLSRHLFLPRHAGALPRLQRQGLRIRGSLCDRA